MNFTKFILAAALSIAAVTPVLAWDGVVTGKINLIEATNNPAQSLKVFVAGAPAAYCTGDTGGFAYFNESDPQFQSEKTAILLAYTMGLTVNLYLSTVSTRCKIGDIMAY